MYKPPKAYVNLELKQKVSYICTETQRPSVLFDESVYRDFA